MSVRQKKWFQWYLPFITRIFHFLFGKERPKAYYEWMYWKHVKRKEKTFNNDHYQHFYTTHFGLTVSDYAGKAILDIGCGPRGSLEWAKMAAQRIGIDPLVEKYKRIIPPNSQMEYVQGNAENMPFSDGQFDFVSSFNSLDHVSDLSQVISEIKRVTKKGGYFLLITDIHAQPTVCEPSAFDWDIVKAFQPDFEVITENHYEGKVMYKSIRAGVEFDHSNTEERYGVLTVKMRRG